MTATSTTDWDGAAVRRWLERRIVAARADQAAAERGGYREQDDCDKASAEEMVCTLLTAKDAPNDQKAIADALRTLLDRDDYAWRGVYDDTKFERHVRAYLRKLVKMAKTNTGFDKLGRYQ